MEVFTILGICGVSEHSEAQISNFLFCREESTVWPKEKAQMQSNIFASFIIDDT